METKQNPIGAMNQILTAAETAKLIRSALKLRWPLTKFSVKSSNFSQGQSVDISYTDGPALKVVETLCNEWATSMHYIHVKRSVSDMAFEGVYDLVCAILKDKGFQFYHSDAEGQVRWLFSVHGSAALVACIFLEVRTNELREVAA